MVTWIVLGAYLLVWLVTARLLYGRWRGTLKPFEGSYCWNCRKHPASDTETAWRAAAAALLWPLAWLALAFTFRPPPTAAERAATEARLKARITELEREAGLRP